jgi:hypothetical protein
MLPFGIERGPALGLQTSPLVCDILSLNPKPAFRRKPAICGFLIERRWRSSDMEVDLVCQ